MAHRSVHSAARRRLRFEPIHAAAGSSFYSKSFDHRRQFEFAWHHHPELELALIVKGRGRRYVGDSIEDFSPGDLTLIGADVPHTWHSDPEDGGVASKVIQFLPTVFASAIAGTPELRTISALLERADRGLRVHGPLREDVERLFVRIVENQDGGWRQVCDLIHLLGALADAGASEVTELSGAAPRRAADERVDRKVDRVFALLHRPPDEIPSQAQAARAVQMSPQAFSRFFRNAVGKTYVECVNEIRVLAACRDLIETDRSIIEIAYAAGFNNLSNFNRRFRAVKGTTPREFRGETRVE